jgi:hypothetical protein
MLGEENERGEPTFCRSFIAAVVVGVGFQLGMLLLSPAMGANSQNTLDAEIDQRVKATESKVIA